jgi:hypothetical protein
MSRKDVVINVTGVSMSGGVKDTSPPAKPSEIIAETMGRETDSNKILNILESEQNDSNRSASENKSKPEA